LGLAVVGGLVVSQTLTLYVTPAFYVWMEGLRARLGRARADEPIATDSVPVGARTAL
jgi:HAE1 family hydrophobic/amphiphilic exporter-1